MTEESRGAMQVDPDLVRQLAVLLDDNSLTEIEVQDGDRRIRVARTVTVAAPQMQAHAPAAPALAALAAATPAASMEADPANHPGAVRSPMVGTAYLSATPGSKPFVSSGDKIAAGDTLLIVEAMKVMNPIISPRAGTVKRVLVDNAQPVEFDQPLVIVE